MTQPRPVDDAARVTLFYDAIDDFQRTHRLPGLQHAQMRGLLAEHLAGAVPVVSAAAPSTNQTAAAPAPRVPRPLDIEHDELMDRAAAEHRARTDAETARKNADRAAVLEEAADVYARLLADMGADVSKDPRYWTGVHHVVTGLRRLAAEARATVCGECGHPKDVHTEREDPVSVGRCTTCPPDGEDWHDYKPTVPPKPPVHGESVAALAGYGPDGHDQWQRDQQDDETQDGAQRCPAKHGALGRICELPHGHPGMHTGSGSNGSAVWDGDAP